MANIIIPKKRIETKKIVKEIPKEWIRAKGIWPDRLNPLKYQRKLRKEYDY